MTVELLAFVKHRLDQKVMDLYDGKRGSCSAKDCPNDVYANNYCNAHYIRSRKGADMSKPVQNKASLTCIECEDKINNKGGWNRCAKHFKSARQKTIKAAIVEALGGECVDCGGKFPLEVYDFHHIGEKDFTPSYLISNGSLESIVEEINKCVLLCANCHRIHHAK